MPARSKMLRNGTIRGQDTLGVPWGFEPAHAPLALTRRLVGVFRPVVQIAMLAMFYSRYGNDSPENGPLAVGRVH